jgi:hypothetical protein
MLNIAANIAGVRPRCSPSFMETVFVRNVGIHLQASTVYQPRRLTMISSSTSELRIPCIQMKPVVLMAKCLAVKSECKFFTYFAVSKINLQHKELLQHKEYLLYKSCRVLRLNSKVGEATELNLRLYLHRRQCKY